MFDLTFLTVIKVAHLVGLIMGLGGAVLADLTVFTRGVIRPVSAYTIHQVEFLAHIVSVGLIILWVTGTGLILVNSMGNPEYLNNPKLWAKIFIVVTLTVNGIFVHSKVLPFLHNSIGLRLFDRVSKKTIGILTFFGSVSVVSWAVPFVLGKASELNHVMPMSNILLVYLGCVLATWLGLFAVMTSIRRIQEYVAKVAALTLLPNDLWEQTVAVADHTPNRTVVPFAARQKMAGQHF